jgi:hypothetical protein
MLGRCLNPNATGYENYGARGIAICERWMWFENFAADMGQPPSGMSLSRINNDGPYCPENCRWATPLEQSNNRRNTPIICAFGQTKTLAQWARHLGLGIETLRYRIKHSWKPQDIVSTQKHHTHTP